MQSVETEGKTKKEAIALACEQLNAAPEQLDIEIIEKGSGILMSLFSAKKTKIRATLIGSSLSAKDTEGVQEVQAILKKNVDRIQEGATAEMQYRDDEILFTINGDGSGIFIGKHGQTLEAIQYLLNKIRILKLLVIPHQK